MTTKNQNEIEKEIEELRVYLNTFLDSSHDIMDLSLKEIIETNKEHKGFLIDYISFEKLQALLQQSKEFIEMIEKQIEEFEKIIIDMKDTEQKVKYNCIKKRWTQEDKVKDVICNLNELKSSIIGSEEKK